MYSSHSAHHPNGSTQVNQNLETPLAVAAVRVDGATNTRKSFLGWLIQPWLARHTDNQTSKSNNLQGALYTARAISHVLQETDLFHSVDAKIQRSQDHLTKDGHVDIVFNVREKGRFYFKTATEFGNNEGSLVSIIFNLQQRYIDGVSFHRVLPVECAIYSEGLSCSRDTTPPEQRHVVLSTDFFRFPYHRLCEQGANFRCSIWSEIYLLSQVAQRAHKA